MFSFFRSCKLLLLIILSITLSGCMDADCLQADDFGFITVTIPAKYSDSSKIRGDVDNQIAPWRSVRYPLNGSNLVITVKNWETGNDMTPGTLSAWCPWYGGHSGATGLTAIFDPLALPFKNALSYICRRLAPCKWSNNDMCAPSSNGDAAITNAPCLMTKGVGLYALITAYNIPSDPNANTGSMSNPETYYSPGLAHTMHLGEAQNSYTVFDMDSNGHYSSAGGVVYTFTDDQAMSFNGGSLYFKILDKHYGDNSGQYIAIIKSGVNGSLSIDPFEYVTNLVATYFFGNPYVLGSRDQRTAEQSSAILPLSNSNGLVETIYNALIQNTYYKIWVRTSLTLYIILTALYYLSGLLQLTRFEVISRFAKVAVVSALLDPNLGWAFFHDYLFVYFVEGVQYILMIVQRAASTGPGANNIVALMMAPQTLAKLFSLLFTTRMGFIYIILYIILFYMIFGAFFKATVTYLNSLVMVGMIIMMAPIFICFMLFGMTKSLAENWLRQLISYAVKPIILMMFLAFISIAIRHEIYTTLGFPVCKMSFPDFGVAGNILEFNDIFSWWAPKPNPAPGEGSSFSSDLVAIPVPEDHWQLDSNGNTTSKYCKAYECIENRYPQLPFLDPNSDYDMDKKSRFFGGSFVQVNGMLFLVILTMLLVKASEKASSIAKALTDTSGSAASSDNVTNTGLKGIAGAALVYGAKKLMGARNKGGGGGGGEGGSSGGSGGPRNPMANPINTKDGNDETTKIATAATKAIESPTLPVVSASGVRPARSESNILTSGVLKEGLSSRTKLSVSSSVSPSAPNSVSQVLESGKVDVSSAKKLVVSSSVSTTIDVTPDSKTSPVAPITKQETVKMSVTESLPNAGVPSDATQRMSVVRSESPVVDKPVPSSNSQQLKVSRSDLESMPMGKADPKVVGTPPAAKEPVSATGAVDLNNDLSKGKSSNPIHSAKYESSKEHISVVERETVASMQRKKGGVEEKNRIEGERRNSKSESRGDDSPKVSGRKKSSSSNISKTPHISVTEATTLRSRQNAQAGKEKAQKVKGKESQEVMHFGSNNSPKKPK